MNGKSYPLLAKQPTCLNKPFNNKCIKQKTACDISENIRSSSDIVQAVFILKLA